MVRKLYKPDPNAFPEPEPGYPNGRCMARSRTRDLDRCLQPAVPGMRVCRYHGGKVKVNNLKHGRYSKSLGLLKEAYQDSLNDPTLLDLREPIALLDASVKKMAEKMDTGDTPELRAKALKLLKAFQYYTKEDNEKKAKETILELEVLLRAGASHDKAMSKLVTQAERLARRIEGAWHVKLSKKASVNAQDLVAIFARFIDILKVEAGLSTAERVASRIRTEVLDASRLN